jgi:hypothetical protein
MVTKVAENGTLYREPPYTEEEELELYRAMASGPFTVVHRAAPSPPQKSQPQSPEE